jgi:hypothetical protein
MIKFKQVPDEVVDAAVAMRDRGGGMRDIVRTAINAWPGMINGKALTDFQGVIPAIILPLTQENTDD